MTIQKDLGSAARNAAANRMGMAPSRILGVGVDGLSRWPQLTCHNLVGISPILSVFVSIVGVSWTLSASLVVLYIIYIFNILPCVQSCRQAPRAF
jgi:hypothetical protein